MVRRMRNDHFAITSTKTLQCRQGTRFRCTSTGEAATKGCAFSQVSLVTVGLGHTGRLTTVWLHWIQHPLFPPKRNHFQDSRKNNYRPACVIVIVVGLPPAPLAVTVTCPVRGMPVLVAQSTRITPLFPPDAPDVMLSQFDPAETLAE